MTDPIVSWSRPVVHVGDTGPMALVPYDIRSGDILDLTGSSILWGRLLKPAASTAVDITTNLAIGADPVTDGWVWTRQAGDLDTAGTYQVQVRFTDANGDRSTRVEEFQVKETLTV